MQSLLEEKDIDEIKNDDIHSIVVLDNQAYEGVDIDRMIIQMANPLLSLTESHYDLYCLKLLDGYLGKIDSHQPDKRTVCFKMGDVEKIFGVSEVKPKILEKSLDKLFAPVTIKDKNKKDGFTKIALFDKAVCEKDETKRWNITLSCTPAAVEYFFNIDGVGYFRKYMSICRNIKSRFSYCLFTYLEKQRFLRTWEVSVEDLKAILKCEEEIYNEYKYFNQRVLKKCHKELSEDLGVWFTYEPIKVNKKVVSIRFTVEVQESKPLSIPKNISSYTKAAEYTDKLSELLGENLAFLSEACLHEFATKEEMLTIYKTTQENPKTKYMTILELYDWLENVYIEFSQQSEKHKQEGDEIKNRFRYFLTMVKS